MFSVRGQYMRLSVGRFTDGYLEALNASSLDKLKVGRKVIVERLGMWDVGIPKERLHLVEVVAALAEHRDVNLLRARAMEAPDGAGEGGIEYLEAKKEAEP